MNAKPPSVDGAAECKRLLLCFRGEVQEAEDLSDVRPRRTQLMDQGSSGCSVATS